MAAIPVLISVRTNGDGSEARKPIFKSDFVKFERKYGKAFDTDSVTPGFLVSFAVWHNGRWPESDAEFDEWLDSSQLETREVKDSDLTANFTEERSEPS